MKLSLIVKAVLALLLWVAVAPRSCAAVVDAPIQLLSAQVMLPHRHAVQGKMAGAESTPGMRYWWVASDISIGSTVTNWVDRVQGLPMTNNANTGTNSANGVRFSGSQQLISSTNFTWTVGSGTGTVWVAIRPDVIYSNQLGILGTATTNQLEGLGVTGGSAIDWPRSKAIGPIARYAPGYLTDFAIVMGPSNTNTYYQDGVLLYSDTDGILDYCGRIGQYSTTGSGYSGYIEEVLFSSNVLTAAQVATLHSYAISTYSGTWTRPSDTTSLTNSLASYWRLDETSGTRFPSYGSVNLTTNGSTVTSFVGISTNAVGLNAPTGTNGTLLASTAADVELGPVDFTIAFWFTTGTLPAAGHDICVVTKDSATAGSRDYVLSASSQPTSNYPRFIVFKAVDSYLDVTVPFVLQLNAIEAHWHHMTAWHDSTNKVIYLQVDGGSVSSNSYTGALQAPGSAQFRIGSRQYTGFEDYLHGAVDEVFIWKRLLTDEERRWLVQPSPYSLLQ